MQPSELNDEAHTTGGMLSKKDQTHPSALSLNTNQVWNLVEGERWMPVITNGLWAFDQRNPHTP
jgi:hypothetical protein